MGSETVVIVLIAFVKHRSSHFCSRIPHRYLHDTLLNAFSASRRIIAIRSPITSAISNKDIAHLTWSIVPLPGINPCCHGVARLAMIHPKWTARILE